MIPASLIAYIEAAVLPLYDHFDAAHRRDHVQTVIEQSLSLATFYPETRPDMVYTIAAYHDIGLQFGRETHHIESARLMREDARLREWFTPEEIALMADAAEDHRASSKHAPRTIYGRIVAEADRIIVPETIIRRTIQYGLSHYPEMDREQNWQRTIEHLREKYGDGGYLKLWIPESPNQARMEELRTIIRNPELCRSYFDRIWSELETL